MFVHASDGARDQHGKTLFFLRTVDIDIVISTSLAQTIGLSICGGLLVQATHFSS